MSKEIALIPTQEEMNIFQLMAKTSAQSPFFASKGGEVGILTIFLMARELGVAPMEALMGGINIIMGKAEISPRLMNKMIRRDGHMIDIEESTNEICKIRGTRKDTKETFLSVYSIEDARRAGLCKAGGGYDKHPSDMLFARAFSRLARRVFADVIAGSYIEGELSDSEYVDRAERVQVSGNSVQLHGATVQHEKEKPVVEEAVVKENLITVESFVSILKEKSDEDISMDLMSVYLIKLKTDSERPITLIDIMQHALKPALTSRFLKGYKSWMDAQLETDSVTDETSQK